MWRRVQLQENHASSKTHPLLRKDVVSKEDNCQQQHNINGKCHFKGRDFNNYEAKSEKNTLLLLLCQWKQTKADLSRNNEMSYVSC